MNEALKMIADKVQNNPALKAKLAAELKAAAEKEQDAAKRDALVSAAKNALGIDIAAAAAQPRSITADRTRANRRFMVFPPSGKPG